MRKALIIGIDKYPKAPLNGCVNDAREFASIIGTNRDDSPNFDVKLETNVPTRAELRNLITDLFNADSEIALLYFSGHGFINELGGYIVTPDYKRYDEGVSMDEILNLANNSKAKNRVIILDCCYSGAIGNPQIAGGNTTQIGVGVTILTASKSDEVSMELNGHGVFTHLLLDSLKGSAADIRGNITPGGVYAHIDQSLGSWEQRPVFKTNVTEFTPLRTIDPQVHDSLLRELTDLFPSATDLFQLDPSFEDTNTGQNEHKSKKPYAKPENIVVFKKLQKLQSVGLVVPVGEEFMYFAAMNSKACKLTNLGYHYWRLVNKKRI